MAVMEYVLVRGTLDLTDPYPMQGIELEQVATLFGLARARRLQIHPDDYGWEIVGADGIICTEVVYHPALLPERIIVRAPEGGDLKTTFDTATTIAAQLGANAFNRTTGEEIAHNFPGSTAAQEAKAVRGTKNEQGRSGCTFGLLAVLGQILTQ